MKINKLLYRRKQLLKKLAKNDKRINNMVIFCKLYRIKNEIRNELEILHNPLNV